MRRQYLIPSLILLLTLVQAAGVVWADGPDDPPPPPAGWAVVAASGGRSATTGYRLHSTLGQPGPVGQGSTAGYRLVTGFWPGGFRLEFVYLPLVLRNYL